MLLNAAKCQGYSFYHFWVIKAKPTRVKIIPPPPTQIRVKTLDYWSRDMFSFNFPEKGLGLASQPHFMHDFFKKTMFLMLHSIN